MIHPPLDRLRSYANAEADVTARLLVEAHLGFCPGCASTVADYRRMGEPLPDATLPDQFDVPAFDRSNVDGYAVRAEETYGASEEAARLFRFNDEEIATGVEPRLVVEPGITKVQTASEAIAFGDVA